jgi:hypothetical protein
MKSLAIIAFAALASVVSAQTTTPPANQLSYGEPVAATVWKVGSRLSPRLLFTLQPIEKGTGS